MQGGVLSNVQHLEAEVLSLKERCSRLEAECDALRGQVKGLQEVGRASERAYRSLQDEVRAQLAGLAAGEPSGEGPARAAPAKAGKKGGVQFRQRDSVVAIESARAGAPVGGEEGGRRKRVPTAFPPQIGGASQGARFQNGAEEVEEEGDAEAAAPLRPTRGRQSTAFAPKQASPDSDSGEDEDARPAGGKATGRRRVPTAFPTKVEDSEDEEDDADVDEKASADSSPKKVMFRARESVFDIEGIPTGSKESSGRGGKISRGVSFADGEQSDADRRKTSDEEEEPVLRPVRARIPTACVKRVNMNDEEDEDSDGDDEDQRVTLRPVRTRLPTACPKDEGGRASFKDVMTKREATEIQRLSRTEGPVEPPDILSHVNKSGKKNEELIKTTLCSLYFFKQLDEASIMALVRGMEVFDFPDGADVTRQGNAKGTHFFVVAEGEFDIIRSNETVAVISKGAAFGESAILLSGTQNATVRAKGATVAYGMAGTAVRQILKQQYTEGDRGKVIDGINQVLNSGRCHLFHKLTTWQTQLLYDEAEVQHIARGEIIATEGEGPCDRVFVVLEGGLSVKVDGAEITKVEPNCAAGAIDLAFGEARCSVEADMATCCLSLSKALLKKMFAAQQAAAHGAAKEGDKLKDRLVWSHMMDLLSTQQSFADLGIEQLGAVVDLARLVDVPAGETTTCDGVRLALCLRGSVGASALGASPSAEVPEARTLFGAGGETFGNLAPSGARVREAATKNLFTLRATAAEGQPALLAIWMDTSLEGVLKIGPLRRGESQLLGEASAQQSKGKFTRSPSMKIAVFNQDKVGALQKVFVFRSLHPAQLAQLAQKLVVLDVEAGQTIFSQGDEAKEFFIIFNGMVEIIIDGRKIRTLGMGDYVGERALLFSEPRSATVTALEESELWKMEAEAFHSVVRGPILDYMKDRIAFQNTKVTLESMSCVRVIGRGGFGVVKMVQAKEGPAKGTRYALKCVSKRLAVEQKQQKALANERNILAELDHPFIIKFVRSFHGTRYVYFLMELVTGGELLDAMDELGLLKRPQAQFYVASITLALEFLHERRIAYLDLKGENCLVDQHGYLKMVDFGIAERVTSGRIYAVKGTPLFMAPEVILGKGYTTTADLWGLGVCLYDFMLGKFPFSDDSASKTEVFRAVLKAPLTFPKWLAKDQDTISLLQGLLCRDPNKRAGAGPDGYAEVKFHSWFKDFSWDGLLSRQLTPPFLPKGETYAEDQEEGKGRVSTQVQSGSVAEDDQGADDDAGFTDPDPSWADDF